MPHEDNTVVVPRPIEDEMRTSYIDYSMSVIVGRALPDARDGLKPVHRRVLYAMQDMGFTSDKPYRKCARIVGEVLGKYHPHGDQAAYDTLVRMAQPFSLRYPLIDGQGNFGSVDGDSAAAMRYTEARLSPIAGELIEDIDKDTVDFAENFDATLQEPRVLPGKLPNLLVNGSTGIAVGMATNLPPHQLGEVVDALKLYLADSDVTLQELMGVLPGPDFPTGGIIHGRQGIYDAYSGGRGSIRVRARAAIEEDEKTGRSRIIVTEIPYMVNKANLIISMADLVKERRIEDISDLRDESDRDGMRIVIELKRNANADVVLNNLYKHTQMETSFGMQMLALVDGQPVYLGLKGLLEQYTLHRTEVVTRRTQYLLRKAEERLHIVKGLLLAVGSRANLDQIIRIIRGSDDQEAAKAALVAAEFEEVPIEYVGARLDEVQAKAILDMRLGRLTGLEVQKLRGEGDDLYAKIKDYQDILDRPERVRAIIVSELDDLRERFNDERRTEIVENLGELETEDLIPDEPVVITLTNAGYVKRIPVDAYRVQGRGGKGLVGMQTKEEDFITNVIVTTTHRQILYFTNKGRVHWLKAWRVPEGSRQGKGKAIVNLLEGLEEGERVQAMIPVAEFRDDQFLFFATRQGTVKKTELSAYSRPRVTGIIAVGLEEGDELVGVDLTDGNAEIVLAKANGKSIRFHENDVRPMGRPATGVRGVTLEDGDSVVSLCVIRDKEGHLLTVTENGYGKRTETQEYRLQGRGGSGIITIQTTDRNGRVVAVREARDGQELMVATQRGMVIRIPVDSISVLGRNTQGNRIMRLDENDRVIGVTVLERDETVAAEAAEVADNGPVEVTPVESPEEPGGADDGDDTA